jgi:hypothetical protein
MAEPLFLGVVTIHGIDGTVAYTGLAANENCPESISFQDLAKEKETLDAKGDVKGLKIWQTKKQLTIKLYVMVAAAGGVVASSKTKAVLPAKGSKATVAGLPPNVGTAEDVINSASWIYVQGGTYDFTQEGDLVLTLPLRKYSTDISTQAT